MLLSFLGLMNMGTAQVKLTQNRIGIQTNDPQYNLDIRGDSEDGGGLLQIGNSDLSQRLLFFSGRLYDPNPFLQWKAGSPFRFATDEGGFTERMRITSDGWVGIGTFEPRARLHVADSIRVDGPLFLSAGPQDTTSVIIGLKTGKPGNFHAFNTYLGAFAGNPDFTSTNNTFIGANTGEKTTREANTFIGASVGLNNVQGYYNTFLGAAAGLNNVNGAFNVMLGYAADVSTDVNHSMALGNQAIVNASGKVRIGNGLVTVVEGPVDWSFPSDGRFKENIRENIQGLDFITALRPVSYTFDVAKYNDFIRPDREAELPLTPEQQAEQKEREAVASRQVYSGFIAQEVDVAAKKTGFTSFSGVTRPQNPKDNYGLRYGTFVVPLVKSVQELDVRDQEMTDKITSLERENTQIKRENAELRSRLDALERMVQELAAGSGSSSTSTLQLGAARLEQNQPNPFSAATAIRYFIPETVQKAELHISDVSGRLLKTMVIDVRGAGKTLLEAQTLSPGTYSYTLILDGQPLETKRMVLTR